MAAFDFGQARSAFLSTVRPLSRSFRNAGLFADLAPRNCQLYKIGPSRQRVMTSRRQAFVASSSLDSQPQKMYWYQDFFSAFPFWMFLTYMRGLVEHVLRFRPWAEV